jgi:hypothetical protein
MQLKFVGQQHIIRALLLAALAAATLFFESCQDSAVNEPEPARKLPEALFTFSLRNSGALPATVEFTSLSKNATSLKWDFGNGETSVEQNPEARYEHPGTYQVKLVAKGEFGIDSVTRAVEIKVNKPSAAFNITMSDPRVLPVTVTTENTTAGSAVSFTWSVSGETSAAQDTSFTITEGGIYDLKLIASNAGGIDSVVQQIRVSPYPQHYTTFSGAALELYAWEGEKVMILSRKPNVDRTTMFAWTDAMDAAYAYYRLCTGRDPVFYAPNYFINNRSTIADVASTCGAGCGFLGWTGIEIQNAFFDTGYNAIRNKDQFDQVPFYEFGRNFWFYGDQLAYKANDPVTTGYAVFMRFMAMEAAGVKGAPFGALSHEEFRTRVVELVDQYLANEALDWHNTLGAGKGVPGGFGGGADLFASFCFRLMRDYGGDAFIQRLWKKAGERPRATSTQDAVDNFFLASCAAANKNLTAVFVQWRWPLSAQSKQAAEGFPS